jgi:hypothetical protein
MTERNAYRIHIDQPGPDEAVRTGQVFTGWTTSPDPSESVAITVKCRPTPSQSIPRPDVEAALPGRNAKGFTFSFEPSLNINTYIILLRIGNVECAIAVSLNVDDPSIAAPGTTNRCVDPRRRRLGRRFPRGCHRPGSR